MPVEPVLVGGWGLLPPPPAEKYRALCSRYRDRLNSFVALRVLLPPIHERRQEAPAAW